jgi:hypothetical protein
MDYQIVCHYQKQQTSSPIQPKIMSIIIPSGIDQTDIRVPLQFPLRPDADTVLDAEGRVVMTMDNAIDIRESLKFCKLFSKAPEMWELLGDMYLTLSVLARNNGINHGADDETDRDKCLLCRAEAILNSVQ